MKHALLKDQYTVLAKGEKIRILFLFQVASAWSSWESFYEACAKDETIEVKILLLTRSAVETSQMLTSRDFLEKQNIPYELYEDFDINGFSPHAAVVQFPYDVSYHTPDALSIHLKNKGIRVVYIPYGIEISDTETARKDHFHNFVVENSWHIYTCCEEIKKEYIKYCRNRQAVYVCGSPKFDGLAHKADYPLSSAIREKSHGRRIVLWKMHFPKKIKEGGRIVQITPDLKEYIKFADGMEQFQDIYFVILAHPKMLYGTVASDTKGDASLAGQTNMLFDILRKKDNVYVDSSDDYRNSLYHADAIIMDRSAVMIEAAMTLAPVMLMSNSGYKEPWTNGVRQVAEILYSGSTAKDMTDFLYKIVKGDNPRRERCSEMVSAYFPYFDGKCGRNIKDHMKDSLLNEKPLPLRIAVYGAGDVCRYYFEKEHWLQNEGFQIQAVFDSSRDLWEKDFYGWIIQPPEGAKHADYDVLVIMTEQHYFEIKKTLVYDLYIDERKIWRLDEFVSQIMFWKEEQK